MRLCADMKWTDCSSKVRMRKHLASFICAKKSNLKRIFEGIALPASNHVELSIKCGKVAERSYFVFLKRSRKKSRIMGVCSTNRLFDLIDDFNVRIQLVLNAGCQPSLWFLSVQKSWLSIPCFFAPSGSSILPTLAV